jgi:hypothetical protein
MGLSWFTVTRQAYVSRWARRRDAADALHALGLTLAGGRSRVILRTLPRRRIRTASGISGFAASFGYGGAVAALGVGMVQEPDRRSTCRLGGRSNGSRRSSSPAGRPQVLALANFLASAATSIMAKPGSAQPAGANQRPLGHLWSPWSGVFLDPGRCDPLGSPVAHP